MKTKTLLMTVLVIFATIAFFSCKKNETQKNQTDQTGAFVKDAPGPSPVHITCSGTCPDGDGCRLIIVGANQYMECNCEGCSMEIRFDDATLSSKEQNQILAELSKRNLYTKNLSNFVFKKYNTRSYGITSIEYDANGRDYYIIYDFVTENGDRESVMYVTTYGDQTDESPEITQVDCSGTCDNPEQTCRERYVFDPPSCECTCSGDNCVMIITHE